MNKPFIAQFGVISGNTFLRSVGGKASINSAANAGTNLDVNGTEGILFPSGNTGQRPTGINGIIRYNSEVGNFEGYSNSTWKPLGGSSNGDVSNAQFEATFVKLVGGSISGALNPTVNGVALGNSTFRWSITATTGTFSGVVTSASGFVPVSNSSGSFVGASDKRVNLLANTLEVSGSISPISNTIGTALGTSTARFIVSASDVSVSNGVFPVSNTVGSNIGATDARFNIFANTISITGGFSPSSNSVGTDLGTSTARWNLVGNGATFSSSIQVGGAIVCIGGVQPSTNTAGSQLGLPDKRFYLYANTVDVSEGIVPSTNAVGSVLGTASQRWVISANSLTSSAGVYPVSNTSGTELGSNLQRWVISANSLTSSAGVYPVSNTSGTELGSSTRRWNLYANNVDISGSTNWASGTFSGRIVANSSMSTLLNATASLGAIEVKANSTSASYIAFLRDGTYGTYAGIDVDNQFTVGGWGAGAAMGPAKFSSLGIGTASIGSGSIVATGDIYSAYSDVRLKTNIKPIGDALDKVMSIQGVTYEPNQLALDSGAAVETERRMGVLAQEILEVAPEVISIAPFDMDENGLSKSGKDYMTVKYDRLVPLLIEAIKELKLEIEELKNGTKSR